MKRQILFLSTMLAIFCILFSCKKKEETSSHVDITYKDGKYEAMSSVKDDWGGEAKLEMEVKNGKIIWCVFTSYDDEGKVKDADYGKQDGEIKNLGLYKIAQNAVVQSAKYAELLVETQDLDELDALAGATVSFVLFKNAALQIMKEAKINQEAREVINATECKP